MANTYVLISSSTVGSGGAASVTFSSIPATYTDLILQMSTRGNRAANTVDALSFKFNSDTTAANYAMRSLYGTGSAAASFSDTTYLNDLAYISGNGATASTFASTVLYAPNYAASTAKSFSIDSVGETNATAVRMNMAAYRWSGTAAISTIEIFNEIGTAFLEFSSFYLYGISKS